MILEDIVTEVGKCETLAGKIRIALKKASISPLVFDDAELTTLVKAILECEKEPVIPEHEIVHVPDSTIRPVIQTVVSILTQRGSGYKVEPMNYLRMELLLSQIVIKSERALQSKTLDKLIDELVDVIGYSAGVLGKRVMPAKAREVIQRAAVGPVEVRKPKEELEDATKPQ